MVASAVPLYNGNISETIWRTANTEANGNRKRGYAYQYDALNRLKVGQFRRANSAGGSFNEQANDYNVTGIAYDKNGNIMALDRRGVVNSSNGIGDMDKLIYDYGVGNKLMDVTDSGNTSYGFVGSHPGNDYDYDYDANGNMVSDANKGIAGIVYNHLNLPTGISINGSGGNGTISYIYDATGTKLRKKVVETGKPDRYTYYAGNYVYEGSSLKYFSQPEGYVDGESGFGYVYQYKDHLGNIRLSYKNVSLTGTPSLEIQEENNYYPFGLEHKGYNSNVIKENNYFNYVGKELNESLDYNMLEMDWRHYDPAIGRFVSIDAMAESFEDYTPYHYSNNSPLMYSDPTGLFTDVVNEETGEVYNIEDGWNFRFTVSASDFAAISESGAIPNRLKGAWQKEFWSQVWKELTTSDGSISQDVTKFVIIDEIEDGAEAIDQISNGEFVTAGLTLFLRKVQKAKKGHKLIEKIFKYGKKGKMPTPDLNPEQFKKVGDKLVHKKTGTIYSKSKTSHGNVDNTGDQWKAWPKGTTDFGATSKKMGTRVSIDGDGNVIGN